MNIFSFVFELVTKNLSLRGWVNSTITEGKWEAFDAHNTGFGEWFNISGLNEL